MPFKIVSTSLSPNPVNRIIKCQHHITSYILFIFNNAIFSFIDSHNQFLKRPFKSHIIEVKIIGAGADAVDFALINLCGKNDIVVTQDYGVAAMALGKGAYAIHQSGKWYTDENIDQMLMERHLSKKARRASGKNHLKGPKKRTEEDDVRFKRSFEKLVMTIISP